MSFTSVRRDKLQKAFALAHRWSERRSLDLDEVSHADYRRRFQQIAKLIWEAHGEPGEIPAGAGAALAAKLMENQRGYARGHSHADHMGA